MRRVSDRESLDVGDNGGAPRYSRVTRLVDLLDEDTPRRAQNTKRSQDARRSPSADGEERSRQAPPMESEADNGVERYRREKTPPRREKLTRGETHKAVSAPTILSVTPEGEGDTMLVVMAFPVGREADPLSDGFSGDPKGSPHRVKLRLLVEQYAELRAQGVPMVCGDISEEQASLLLEAGKLCAAIRRGMAALQYGDRSIRRLVASLTAKGIARETAEAAVDYLYRKGYIHEEETARRRAGCDLRKGWGPRRIREDLKAQGLDADAVDTAMEELSEVDFHQACADVIRKKYGQLPAEREARQKMTAALMRLGYDLEHIRSAMELLSRETSGEGATES